ncbi:site-specific integrase [Pseudomonas sp. PDM13]|uniref:site-specific integrase n=1 Tax=Pseudomonas sp. PDM13 TaxID=2769255 RepID=UPI0021E0A692|nr:site-specific integrase [Pseudomonas sp. PDM13]MCU9949809.1 site-specific integrase [Pseudomonas sp. PDM13]
MAGKPMDLPAGVEIFRNSLRVRFTWNGRRRSETLPLPVTQKGIQAASRLRAQVVGLIKMDLLDDAKYAELFPSSANVAGLNTFGEYAQLWLDSRGMSKGTRGNYVSALNLYWQPHLAKTRIDLITTTLLRKIIADTEWSSPGVKRNAIWRLGTVLRTAVEDGVIDKNPAEPIELPRRGKKEVDPFTQAEADQIIEAMYARDFWPSSIYAALYEFMFYSGLRIGEAIALQWDAVELQKRTVRVFRVVALGEVEERTKTHKDRTVLLNDRAIHALEFALAYAERRKMGEGRIKETPFVFPPSKNSEFIKQTSDVHHQWRPILKGLGIRYRKPYNCRHTYATMCLMSGMNPAFIAQQLGNSVQMLLSTYARWINSGSDWTEIAKLNTGIKSVSTSADSL